MDWNAIGAIGELTGAIAVFATLFYLTLQIRISNQQHQLDAIRHTYDSLNAFADRVSASVEIASIVNRGRQDRSSLTADEWLVFTSIHMRVFNTLESWYLLLENVKDRTFVEQQHHNIADVAGALLNFPSIREIYSESRDSFAPGIRNILDTKLSG